MKARIENPNEVLKKNLTSDFETFNMIIVNKSESTLQVIWIDTVISA